MVKENEKKMVKKDEKTNEKKKEGTGHKKSLHCYTSRQKPLYPEAAQVSVTLTHLLGTLSSGCLVSLGSYCAVRSGKT